jgi:hypothetical protein
LRAALFLASVTQVRRHLTSHLLLPLLLLLQTMPHRPSAG